MKRMKPDPWYAIFGHVSMAHLVNYQYDELFRVHTIVHGLNEHHVVPDRIHAVQRYRSVRFLAHILRVQRISRLSI